MGRVLYVLSGLFASAAFGEVEDVCPTVIGNDLNEYAFWTIVRLESVIPRVATHPEKRSQVKRAHKRRNSRLLRSMYSRLTGVRCTVVDRPVRSGCREGEQE